MPSLERDRRMFVPAARGTEAWKRARALWTTLERVNSRIDRVLRVECHTIRGLAKMGPAWGSRSQTSVRGPVVDSDDG